ncbi:hypothetical protein [Acinetobacter baumannii]|uniref:hypothetical protein n=1 Tax=Acinetobacter baumannii TaxID=470 RepID=UPI000ADBA7B3|nr:hypothetical protein [Acinetobacter baumannii]
MALNAEKFANLERDIDDTGKAINTDNVINPRYGDPFKSFPMIARELMTDIFTATIKKDNTIFYTLNGTTVIKDSNPAFFAIELSVSENQKYVIDTKVISGNIVGAYYLTDSNNEIIDLMFSSDVLQQAYVLTIPAGATKLFINCLKDYEIDFSASRVPNALLELVYDGNNFQEFTFYKLLNGSQVIKDKHPSLFAVELDVLEGEYYLIDTKSFGIADEYYVTDINNNLLSFMRAADGTDVPYLLKIPHNGVKLYINCVYAYRKTFYYRKISSTVMNMLAISGKRQDFTFYYSQQGIIKRDSNTGLFSVDINVVPEQSYAIDTNSFGVAGDYYITDAAGNILDYKAATDSGNEYLINIPANASKLYVNCKYDYADNFNFERISNALLEKIPNNDTSVRSVFPAFNYFDKLRVKCPNFYRKFKDKNQDVTVVLTGTSLTQGNLYASDRADATTRPAALHTHDLASSVFDKLIKHWDGQKYRRYDHDDIFYSTSAWVITTNADDWDDHTYIKNGLTKTTTDANASVSTKIPANAWQFNFVYRTNTNGCDSIIEITQGVGYVEVFDGSNWVEAHNYQFSNLETPATATKGNTQYQKRLKMRCKNKAGGVNSIGTEKQITIRKVSSTGRFNVVGFEWSPREYMLFVINGARGGHEWGDPTGNRLDKWQDTDIWSFNPDLLLAEITIINWGASEAAAMSVDPLYYVNIAKRAYFNEFNDMPTSLYAKSSAYTVCDVIFYSDTLAATSAVSGAWDSTTHEPLFGTVTTAASNGGAVDNTNIGRVKNNFENYEAVERYIASKDYLFIPVLSSFKSVAEKFYGGYWQGMQASDKTGNTLSYDGVHFNDNGAALFSKIVASVFDEI